jgi:hypothetical protein
MNTHPDEMKLAERLKHRIFFEGEDMDFMFQYFLSNHGERGAALGELFNVARRVDPKSPSSWKVEFVKEAEKIEAIAEDCLQKGHRISAGDAFLRAYTYYRSAFCAVAPGEDDHNPIYFKATACFKKGIDAKSALIHHEWLILEYKGYKFPGCLFKPDKSNAPKPTLYLHNGGETHAEDHYFMYAQAAIDRGYNCLILDGPWDPCGRFYAPDATYKNFGKDEIAGFWRAVTDMLIARSDVDASRLVLAGESYGGAKTMFHASIDDRYAAVVANSPIYSIPELFKHAHKSLPVYWEVTPEASNNLVNKIPFFAQVTLKRVIWFHGFDSLVDWIPNADFLHVDCKKITSAFLCMYAESEDAELKRQAEYALENVSSKVKGKLVGTLADGADLHCQINNLARAQQLMFDWLDEILWYRIEK